jgi:hypothetical protein
VLGGADLRDAARRLRDRADAADQARVNQAIADMEKGCHAMHIGAADTGG